MDKTPKEFNFIYGICLLLQILGLSILIFALYVVPYAFFGTLYQLPGFVLAMDSWFEAHRQADMLSIFLIFLPFFFISFLCFFEARRLTARVEGQVLAKDELAAVTKPKAPTSESSKAILSLVMMVVLVFLSIWLLGYLLGGM